VTYSGVELRTPLYVTPYALAEGARAATAPMERSQEAGVDVRYPITPRMTLDLTANTDFAQVEADDQQVNLTRFSLFFPEKREFFLEGQGIFSFGGASAQVASSGTGGPGETPLIFYSRRIGLENGQTAPIEAGARLTGRAGAYTVGLIDIRTGESDVAGIDATNFSVVRVKRNILRRSSIGAIATARDPVAGGGGSNQVGGVDANLAFFKNVQINAYYAGTRTTGVSGDGGSYRGDFLYAGDRYGLEVDHLKVGSAFSPGIGYLRRTGFRRDFADVRFSPRPQSMPGIRKLWYEASLDHIVGSDGMLQTQQGSGIVKLMLDNGDVATVTYLRHDEALQAPFPVPGVAVLPVGEYEFAETVASYQLGPQRTTNGTITVTQGGYYDGTHSGASYQGRIGFSPQLAVEPRVSVDRITLSPGTFVTKLVSARTTYSLTPRMFVAALVQYNSTVNSLGANIRFRWEYEPGSDLFVVYGEGRDTSASTFPVLQNRSIVVKYTRLVRF